MTKRIILILLLLAVLCGCGTQAEKTGVVPEFVLTYAENQRTDYPTTQAAREFARLVEERTGGRVVIQVRHSGEFGTEQEVIQQMRFGGVDFARVSLSSLSDDYPILNVLQLPFLYEDADHMWRILDGPIGQDFLQVFAGQELVGLSWYDAGARSFYSTVPIFSLEDLEGQTIRVQNSQMMADMVTLLGAEPVNFAFSDVYAAFEQGQITAAENNWPSYQSQHHYQLAPYYTVDQHTRVPEVQLASAMTWNQLPEEYRTVIQECARESAVYQRKLWTEQEAVSRDYAIVRGCQVITLPPEELQRLRALVQPLYEQYCGGHLDLIDQIQMG